MSRFKVGDRVLILPQYRRLYPGDAGTVIGLKPDRFGRSDLDEYLVAFSPTLKKVVLDCRVAGDTAVLPPVTAKVVRKRDRAQLRGMPMHEMVFETPDMDIHLSTNESRGKTSLIGQILQKKTERFLPGAEVRLLRGGSLISVETTNEVGEFRFSTVPEGTVTLEIWIGPKVSRVSCRFAVSRSKTA